jgi:hypothetical protein
VKLLPRLTLAVSVLVFSSTVYASTVAVYVAQAQAVNPIAAASPSQLALLLGVVGVIGAAARPRRTKTLVKDQ